MSLNKLQLSHLSSELESHRIFQEPLYKTLNSEENTNDHMIDWELWESLLCYNNTGCPLGDGGRETQSLQLNDPTSPEDEAEVEQTEPTVVLLAVICVLLGDLEGFPSGSAREWTDAPQCRLMDPSGCVSN